jgi:predicted nucleic acid-binding protein
MNAPRIIVHTDVIAAHLQSSRSPSVLRQAMSQFLCYTTVFQAIELFSMAPSAREVGLVEDALGAMKILGLSARGAKTYARLIAQGYPRTRWDMLIAGLCLESRLPLLTSRRADFRGVDGLVIVTPRLVAAGLGAEGILKAVRS